MSTELTKREVGVVTLKASDFALLKKTICPDLGDDEMRLFGAVCQRTGLDPFARQIHAVKRGGKLVIQTGIDGFRLTAERSGEYLGQTPPEWCGADGAWRDVWLADEHPEAARVGVIRRGFEAPVYGVAHWKGYVQAHDGKPSLRWGTDPAGMLAKCAEAQAIRKAFPQELGGVYVDDEMGQAETTGPRVQMPRAKGAPAPAPTNPGHVAVESVAEKQGETNGKPWTKYTVRLTDGTEVPTFSESIAEAARGFEGTGEAVIVETEQTTRGVKLIGISAADQPRG